LGIVFAQLYYSVNNTKNRAELDIAASGKANDFAADLILLISEGEGCEAGGQMKSGKYKEWQNLP
jgi:hypothetical protein